MRYKYYTKEQADKILHKIYKRIRKKEVVVRFNKQLPKRMEACVNFNYEETIITINPTFSLVECFLHEYLHILYLGKKEKEIVAREKEITSLLTNVQIENLIRRISSIIRHKPVKIE